MFCKDCGAEISDDSQHCSECGAKINNNVNVVEKESFLNKNKKKLLVCCVGLFVIFFLIAFLSLLFPDVNDNSTVHDNDMNLSEDDFKAQCKVVEYNKLNKRADKYVGEKLKLSGKIIQIMEDDSGGVMRVALDEYYSDVVYVVYIGNNDFVEDDYVTVYGYGEGDYSYTSVTGASITVPKINAKYIDNS